MRSFSYCYCIADWIIISLIYTVFKGNVHSLSKRDIAKIFGYVP